MAVDICRLCDHGGQPGSGPQSRTIPYSRNIPGLGNNSLPVFIHNDCIRINQFLRMFANDNNETK